MCISTFLIAILGYFVTEKIVEPRLGPYLSDDGKQVTIQKLDNTEKRALKYAFLSILIYIICLGVIALPSDSLLRNPSNGSFIGSPFLKSIIFIYFSFLLYQVLCMEL